MRAERDRDPRLLRQRRTSKVPTTPTDAIAAPPFVRAASMLRVLGVSENLRLLTLLLSGPMSVDELAHAMGRAAYLIARRVSKLTRAGLLVARSDTKHEVRGARVRRLVGSAFAHLDATDRPASERRAATRHR